MWFMFWFYVHMRTNIMNLQTSSYSNLHFGKKSISCHSSCWHTPKSPPTPPTHARLPAHSYLNTLPYALLKKFLDPNSPPETERLKRSAPREGEQIFCEWNIRVSSACWSVGVSALIGWGLWKCQIRCNLELTIIRFTSCFKDSLTYSLICYVLFSFSYLSKLL